MLGFILRRILYMFPILAVVTFIIFLLMWMQPGDVVDTMCGLGCPSDLREAMRERFGLSDSIVVQYGRWIYGIVGRPEFSANIPFLTWHVPDFGYSPTRNMPAWDALLGENRWVWTLVLVFSSMFISWLVAIPIGIYSATHKYSLADHTFTLFGFLGLSIPNFVLGLLFLWLVVGVLKLGLQNPFFQVGGILNSNLVGEPIWKPQVVLNFAWHIGPPVLILAASSTSAIIRYMRGSMLDVMEMAYIQTARAKGLKERVVVYKHATRNAINPLISMLGFWIPFMMEGALVIAIIFNLPQIEKTFFESIFNRDNMVVMTGLFVFSVILMLGNLISDVLLALSDPKIRYE